MDLLIENFKGIKSFKYEDIKPITLLSGTNSGGKTSLIQSILMLKQSMEFGTPDMPIVFNGKYTRLGSLENTVHKGEKDIIIEITTNLNGKHKERRLRQITKYIENKEIFIKTVIEEDESGQLNFSNFNELYSQIISISYKLVIGKKRSSEFPYIKQAQFTLKTENGNDHILLIEDANNRVYSVHTNSPLFINTPFLSPSTPMQKKHVLELIEKDSLLKRFNLTDEILFRQESIDTHPIKKEKIIFERLLISKAFFEDFLIKSPIDEIQNSDQRVDFRFIRLISILSTTYFTNIEFIGPLREEPKSLYLKESDIISDVGIKGENAGFIFANNNQKKVECPVVDEQTKQVTSKQMSLENAVNYWINNKFKLAKSITVNKYKKDNIYEIEVTNFKNIKTSISSVGFGISQIFPIIVSSLMSGENTILIFEQPEIHLHPAVQSLLFDFIYSLSKISPSKKIIVETHSDHLINKYRIYKIEHPNDIDSSTAVFFTDPKNSTLKLIEFDEFGSLEEWPEGFFDQAAIDSKYIFEKQLEKRLNESAKKTKGGI